MKPIIKFAHAFDKLHVNFRGSYRFPAKEAKLLQVIKVHTNELSEGFIWYDTRYRENALSAAKFYPLEPGPKILLIFEAVSGMIFTTLRNFSEDDFRRYKAATGETFDVVVMGK